MSMGATPVTARLTCHWMGTSMMTNLKRCCHLMQTATAAAAGTKSGAGADGGGTGAEVVGLVSPVVLVFVSCCNSVKC